MSGQPTQATFLITVSTDGGKTVANRFTASQVIDVVGHIRVAPEHVGRSGSIYYVAYFNSNWYTKTPQGWIAWDIKIPSLVPPTPAHTLTSVETFDISSSTEWLTR